MACLCKRLCESLNHISKISRIMKLLLSVAFELSKQFSCRRDIVKLIVLLNAKFKKNLNDDI